MNIIAVVVTYNRMELLKRNIRCLQQNKPISSIVIVNNGSTDGTTEWLAVPPNMGYTRATCSWLKVTRPFRVSSIVTSCILTVSMATTCFKLSVRKIPPLVVSVCSAGAEQLQRRGKNKPSKKIL